MSLSEKKSLQPSQTMAACSLSSIGCNPMLRQVVLLSYHVSDVLTVGAKGPNDDNRDLLDDLTDKGGVAEKNLDANADRL